MDPGQRDRLVTFQRATVTSDDYGGETPAWGTLARAWVRVRYGTGQERREAAQERADQAATFEAEWSPELATVVVTDRIESDGEIWDITSVAPLGHKEIHFTAVRAV
jgi:SPP1 family predicted phage head-tail adaptor